MNLKFTHERRLLNTGSIDLLIERNKRILRGDWVEKKEQERKMLKIIRYYQVYPTGKLQTRKRTMKQSKN